MFALYFFFALVQTVKHKKLLYIIPIITFGLFYLLYKNFFPFDFSSNQFDFVYSNLSIDNVFKNLYYYSYIFTHYVSGGLFYFLNDFLIKISTVLTVLILCIFLAIVTKYCRYKKRWLYICFTHCTYLFSYNAPYEKWAKISFSYFSYFILLHFQLNTKKIC